MLWSFVGFKLIPFLYLKFFINLSYNDGTLLSLKKKQMFFEIIEIQSIKMVFKIKRT